MLISVVIPTCHRNDLLVRCLDQFAPGRQTAAADDYEVLVSDDGQRTTAQAVICEKYSWARWLPGPRRGPAANRNHGAKAAQGEWIAFVDDDCEPDHAWIQTIKEAIQAEPLDVVEGKTITPDYVDNPFRQGVENLHGGVYWSCNLAVRRETIARLGGFDEDFLEAGGEDMEFAFRISKEGLRARFVPGAVVRHPVRRLTWRSIWTRLLMIRWISLYNLKTGRCPSLETGPVRLLIWLAWSRFLNLTRTSWHFFSRFERTGWRTRFFWQAIGWASFPFLFPYVATWELRFRRRERALRKQEAGRPASLSAR